MIQKKRTIYTVEIAKTAEDNGNLRYDTKFRTIDLEMAEKVASEIRKNNPDYAFIVVKSRQEICDNSWGLWGIDYDAENPVEVIEYF